MLIFVGVGPGDPELMTVKAIRVLREADAIAVADSGSGAGAVSKIAGEYMQGKPVVALSMPMKGDRANWREAHARAAARLMELLGQYNTVAYPVLGDPGIYASSSYLMRLIAPVHPVRVIPGIPAMCAAAAALGQPLCEQRERLTVLDSLDEGDSLPEGNVVVMKCGRRLEALREAAGSRPAFAVRNMGMLGEWIGPLRDMPQDDYSYFTTALVRAGAYKNDAE